MKRFCVFFGFIILLLPLISTARGQGKETFTGTVLYYGTGFNTRAYTRLFTLNINGQTFDAQAQRYLGILQENGQDKLLDAIRNEDLGRFSVGPNVGIPINVVRESAVNGQRRIFVVFERWKEFAELRGGYRSLDYPFGVIELSIDEATGKGSGTYIAAAQIRWRHDEKSGQYQVEIENFATFPAKLLGVTLRK
ncbi:MAG: hypothetical protein ACR2GD_01770 [Pyrinomonadaceae bacterium]